LKNIRQQETFSSETKKNMVDSMRRAIVELRGFASQLD